MEKEVKSIQDQIQELTEELRPWVKEPIYYFGLFSQEISASIIEEASWPQLSRVALYWSTNKIEVEEYADCYRRLKLYHLLGEKAAKEYPFPDYSVNVVRWSIGIFGTDFQSDWHGKHNGRVTTGQPKVCVLGGVWFAREEDRLQALKICGIDKAFQERCAKYRLGGA